MTHAVRRLSRRVSGVFAGAVLISALLPQLHAFAATDCLYHWGSRTMTVTVNDPGAAPTLDVVSDKLRVDGVICGGANRWSVDTLNVNDASGGNVGVIVDLGQGPFRPGSTGEPDTSDEIEFAIDLGGGSADWLRITGQASDVVDQTSAGINLNASEPAPKDIDMTLAGVESVDLVGVSTPPDSECVYHWGTRSMTVTVVEPGTAPTLDVVSDKLRVDGVICGGANRWSVDTLTVKDGTGGNVGVIVDLGQGPFRPGSAKEPDTSDEIEFAIDLGGGNADWLRITGTSADVVEQSAGGINLNASEPDPRDIDMTVAGVESVDLVGVTVYAPAPPVATGCTYNSSTKTVEVSINDVGTAPVVKVVGDQIHVSGSQCGTATRWNTNTVSVTDSSGGNVGVNLELGTIGSLIAFRPGNFNEAGNSDEIEFVVDLGGGASDFISITGSSGADVLALGQLGINFNGSEADGKDVDMTLSGVDSVRLAGGNSNDTLTSAGGFETGAGSLIPAKHDGGTGADTLVGGDAADEFIGGSGWDKVDYSARSGAVSVTIDGNANDGRAGEGDAVAGSVEWVVGGSGDDFLDGNGDMELLEGGPGNDHLVGSGGDDELRGDAGNDHLQGMGDDDLLVGGLGNDREDGGGFNDVMVQADQEVYTLAQNRAIPDVGTNSLKMTVTGSPGTMFDVNARVDIEHPRMQDLVVTLYAPSGKVGRLLTNRGNGTPATGMQFDSEAVVPVKNMGSQPMSGRYHPDSSMELFDTLDANGTWTLQVTDQNGGSVGTINMLSLEIVFSPSTHDGSDQIIGGDGSRDLADYAGRNEAVTVTLEGGADDGQLGEFDDVGLGADDVEDVYAGLGNDDLTGTDVAGNEMRGGTGHDVLRGLAGDDTFRGNFGADELIGGTGNDLLYAGTGPETYDGGEGVDTLNYQLGTVGVNASLTTGNATGADGNDTIAGVENLTGSRFDDTLEGDGGVNVILANQGNDTLRGLAGKDTLNAGAGNDSINGGADIDFAVYIQATSKVIVDLSAGTASGGYGNDTLTGVENVRGSPHGDEITGDDIGNFIQADGGDDKVWGLGGNDRLEGGNGNDWADGGAGTDTCASFETKVNCEG